MNDRWRHQSAKEPGSETSRFARAFKEKGFAQ